MERITACQRVISDRFPVASFAVEVPRDRFFEIACATDPNLFRGDYRGRRTANNFFTSRSGGLLRAPAGQAIYMLPPDQLRRFAGQHRIYYALATYGSPRGDSPSFTILPGDVHRAPALRLAPDFSGKSLDRGRLNKGQASSRYGGGNAPLMTWGGDLNEVRASPQPQRQQRRAEVPYDDGYGAELWQQEDRRSYGKPSGRSGAPPALKRASARYGGAKKKLGGARIPRGPMTPDDLRAMEQKCGPRRGPANYGAPKRAPAPPPPQRRQYEDAPALRRAAAPARQLAYGQRVQTPQNRGSELRYGRRATKGLEDSAPSEWHPAPIPGRGVDDDWDDELTPDTTLALAPAMDVASDLLPLTIEEKLRILQPAAEKESGDVLYSAVQGDVEYQDSTHPAYQRIHHGAHFGLVQFTQRSGTLGKVLAAFERRAPDKYQTAFAAIPGLKDAVTAPDEESRVAPIAQKDLWSPECLKVLSDSGQVEEMKFAQNEVAVEHFFDAQLGFAAALGLTTDRALGMLYDRSIHMGRAAAQRFVLQAISPLRTEEDLAAALVAVGVRELAEFQTRVALPADGSWTPATHAKMLETIRALGGQSSFGPPPAVDQMLDALVEAARGRRFEQRLTELRSSDRYQDRSYRLS